MGANFLQWASEIGFRVKYFENLLPEIPKIKIYANEYPNTAFPFQVATQVGDR
jgi:hypothetical protein